MLADRLPSLLGLERLGQARHLGAQQLADLGQVGGDAFLLPGQVVDLALCRDAVPLHLVLGVRRELIGLRLGLGDDLIGVLLGVGDQLLGVLLGLAPGVVRLRAGLGGALFRRGGALLRLGDQLLGRRLRRRQAFCLLAL